MTLKFKDVNYSYRNEELVLDNFSLKVKQGEMICLRGGNGEGKTTLIKIVTKLLYDYDGEILLNDINLKQIDRNEVLESIGVCFQSTAIYPDTIQNNVKLGSEKMEPDYFQETLEGFDFVEKYFNNEELCSVSSLSGGQVQKIGILRCIFTNKPILIFDEPTSSLDEKSKRTFLKVLEHLKGKKTIIIISHDDIFLDNCNNYFLKKGIGS